MARGTAVVCPQVRPPDHPGFSLQSRPKPGGERRFCLTLGEARTQVARLADDIGITRVSMVGELGDIGGVEIAQAARPDGCWSSTLGEAWSYVGEILTGPRGSAIFADGAWWHTSRPNRTAALRCALLVTYTHTFCVPQEEMRLQMAALTDPPEDVMNLLGGKQYQSRRDFPY